MKTKIEIKSIFESVLFEYKTENNSIKKTLERAIIEKAYLQRADLQGANLQGAYLQGAYLQRADLQGAYLQEAYLQGADLQGANLQGAENVNFIKIKQLFWIIPEEGAFIAWKKCYNNIIAKLEIPSDAKRTSNLLNRKCRAEFVKVLSLHNITGKQINDNYAVGMYDKQTNYVVGQITKANKFDDDWTKDCTNGIHFFLTFQEAADWNM